MQKIRFDVGEQRRVRLLIHAADDAPFRIQNATWVLRYAGQVIDSGDCEVKDHIISVFLVAPERKTYYTIAVTFQINDEVLVEQLELEVV